MLQTLHRWYYRGSHWLIWLLVGVTPWYDDLGRPWCRYVFVLCHRTFSLHLGRSLSLSIKAFLAGLCLSWGSGGRAWCFAPLPQSLRPLSECWVWLVCILSSTAGYSRASTVLQSFFTPLMQWYIATNQVYRLVICTIIIL